jgi:hypothetical protein
MSGEKRARPLTPVPSFQDVSDLTEEELAEIEKDSEQANYSPPAKRQRVFKSAIESQPKAVQKLVEGKVVLSEHSPVVSKDDTGKLKLNDGVVCVQTQPTRILEVNVDSFGNSSLKFQASEELSDWADEYREQLRAIKETLPTESGDWKILTPFQYGASGFVEGKIKLPKEDKDLESLLLFIDNKQITSDKYNAFMKDFTKVGKNSLYELIFDFQSPYKMDGDKTRCIGYTLKLQGIRKTEKKAKAVTRVIKFD